MKTLIFLMMCVLIAQGRKKVERCRPLNRPELKEKLYELQDKIGDFRKEFNFDNGDVEGCWIYELNSDEYLHDLDVLVNDTIDNFKNIPTPKIQKDLSEYLKEFDRLYSVFELCKDPRERLKNNFEFFLSQITETLSSLTDKLSLEGLFEGCLRPIVSAYKPLVLFIDETLQNFENLSDEELQSKLIEAQDKGYSLAEDSKACIKVIEETPIAGCEQSILKNGECLLAGDSKTSCNGCFKLEIMSGWLVVRYNIEGEPILTFTYNYSNGETAKICADPNGYDGVAFYKENGERFWGHVPGRLPDMRLLDNGQIVFRSRTRDVYSGTQWIGEPTSCAGDQEPDDCPESILPPGESFDFGTIVKSCNDLYNLELTVDGYLVLYDNFNVSMWISSSSGGVSGRMDASGNFILEHSSGAIILSTDTSVPGSILKLFNNGQLAIVNGDEILFKFNQNLRF